MTDTDGDQYIERFKADVMASVRRNGLSGFEVVGQALALATVAGMNGGLSPEQLQGMLWELASINERDMQHATGRRH